MKIVSTYPVHFSGALLILFLTGYAIFEIAFNTANKSGGSIQEAITTSLHEGVNQFKSVEENLIRSSEEIERVLEQGLAGNQSKSTIFNHFPQSDIWGTTIFKNGAKWLWKDFVLRQPIAHSGKPTFTYIRNLNNLTLLAHQRIVEFDDDTYLILTASRLEQSTDMAFIQNAEFNLAKELRAKGLYPVNFTFSGSEPQQSRTQPLVIAAGDTVGTVWATAEDSGAFVAQREESRNRWRFFFQLCALIAFFIFVGIISRQSQSLPGKLLPLLIIAIAWPVILHTGVLDYWLELIFTVIAPDDPQTVVDLGHYITHSVFVFLLFLSIHNILSFATPAKPGDNFLSTIFVSVLFGIITLFLIHFFSNQTFTLLTTGSIPLMDLELAPDILSFIFYLSSGIFFTGIAGLIITTGYYIYTSEEGKAVIISIVTIFTFYIAYFFADLIADTALFTSWLLAINTTLLLLFLLLVQLIIKYTDKFVHMSGFRKLMLSVFVASAAIYIIILNSMSIRTDDELVREARLFAAEEDISTQEILFQVLSYVEQEFIQFAGMPPEDQIRIIQNQFQRTIHNNIDEDWRHYSYHIRLLTPDGTELASYSTSIDTPAWSTFLFNTDTMLRSYRGEQIRWQTNRPVIWGRPANLSDRYTQFDRGWIPVYNRIDGYSIILWIAGDVYKERLDYNKPLRAVLSEATGSDWKQSYYMAEYLGERLTRSNVKGIYQNQPQYNRLPEREATIAARDSVNLITNITPEGVFREVLLTAGDRKIIKASTPVPGFNHHLFSFFRLQIVLIFFGLFCFALLATFGMHQFSLFGQNRKFKDRLIDGLSLATILFLTVLIFATQYAVGIQNEKNVERDLVQNLSAISETLKQRNIFSDNFDTTDLLSGITSPLNADLIFYKGADVEVSTTPQIFQQHLLPTTIAFPAYDFLYNRERTHFINTARIGDEEMVIGYRAIPDAEGRPAGVIAIPTFLQSPVYNEQLLETTSYLFAVYLLIFILFIVGSVFLSSQLTKPLNVIQAGLNKISQGDMKTKVSVTSRDEIGSLAMAYNNMVQRLDYAQKELMKAERESAWKEMAQQVAHEIKNPLTPMKLNLQHLQRRLENNPEEAADLKPLVEKTTTNIIEQIESLNKIASDFSKFAKPIYEPKKNTDLTALVRSVGELYEHDDTATVKVSLPKKEIMIPAVEDELRRALINLIKNGIEAAQNGSVLISIKLKKMRDHVMIQIKDNGSGINEEDRDHIFLPKFSTKSSGTGLGLAITKKIVEAHEGDIWFESKNGQGTSFFIRLPLN